MKALRKSHISRVGELYFPMAEQIYSDFSESNIEFSRKFLGTTGNPFTPPKSQRLSDNTTISADDVAELFENMMAMMNRAGKGGG